MLKATMKKETIRRLVDDLVLDTLRRSGFGNVGGTGLDSATVRSRIAREAGVPVYKISAQLISGSLRRLANRGDVEAIAGTSRTCWKSGAASVSYSDPASYRLAERS